MCFNTLYNHKEVKNTWQTTTAQTNYWYLKVEQALQQMKYEIATEFGVQLGADTTSRANGSVGGEITKRLVQMAEQQLGGGFNR